MNQYDSFGRQCLFLMPATNEVELMLQYSGQEWHSEGWQEESLRVFSERCRGLEITLFESNGAKFLMFSGVEGEMDQIAVSFEKISAEILPCAFYDRETKEYDNFSLPQETVSLLLQTDQEGAFSIQWETEEAEETDRVIFQKDAAEENERLRILLSQLIDQRFQGDYIRTLDTQIDEKIHDLQTQESVLQEKEASLQKLQERQEEIEAAVSEIRMEIRHRMEIIRKAESMQKEVAFRLQTLQYEIEKRMQTLGLDAMVTEENSVKELLLEAQEIRKKLESKLKELLGAMVQQKTE